MNAKKGLFFLLFIFFGLWNTFPEPEDKYYEQGLNTKELNEKIKYFSIALKLNPNHSPSLIQRADTFFRQNLFGECEKDLEEFEQKFGINDQYLVLKGNLSQRNGIFDQAEDFYREALKLNERNNEAHFQLGILLNTFGQLKENDLFFEQAIENFEKVNKESEFFPLALSQAASCYEHLQKYEKAENAYQALCGIQPTHSSHFFNLGRIQYMNKSFEESKKNLELASELTFKDRTLRIIYPVFFYYVTVHKLKDPVSGKYHLSKFLEKFPSSPLGDLFLEKIPVSEFQEATLSQKSISGLSSRRKQSLRAETFCHLGLYYILENEIEKAIECFNQSLELKTFGAYFYYLSVFERQRLNLAKEMGISPQ